jgi:hypothetical protein
MRPLVRAGDSVGDGVRVRGRGRVSLSVLNLVQHEIIVCHGQFVDVNAAHPPVAQGLTPVIPRFANEVPSTKHVVPFMKYPPFGSGVRHTLPGPTWNASNPSATTTVAVLFRNPL